MNYLISLNETIATIDDLVRCWGQRSRFKVTAAIKYVVASSGVMTNLELGERSEVLFCRPIRPLFPSILLLFPPLPFTLYSTPSSFSVHPMCLPFHFNNGTGNFYHRLCISLQAVWGNTSVSPYPLVLTSIGEGRSKKIFGGTATTPMVARASM